MVTSTQVVHSDPKIMGGTAVFVGTRVPFQTLLDYLEAGDPLSEFLEDFPTVSRDQAVRSIGTWRANATSASSTSRSW